jgi:glyoxylase-like metal-dependent hydrolase (beta-lactamase superfamily II)
MKAVAVAAGVHLLPFPMGQAYLVETDGGLALFDTSIAGSGLEILGAVEALGFAAGDLKNIVVSHYHRDHRGALAELLKATNAVSMAGAPDAPVIRGEREEPAPNLTPEEEAIAARIVSGVPEAPAARVDIKLDDGAKPFADAIVVHIPGHTAGSIGLHLPHRGVLLTGDVVASVNGRPILGPFNVDRELAKKSVQRLAALDFQVACFGHGAPITRDAKAAIADLAASLVGRPQSPK